MTGYGWWRIRVCLLLMVVPLSTHCTVAQTNSSKPSIDVACLTERPTVSEGGSTALRASVTIQDGQGLQQSALLTWQVTDGIVQGNGPEVQWNLSNVSLAPGELRRMVTATVRATSTEFGDATCAVTVFIGRKEVAGREEPPAGTRGGRTTGRRYLAPNEVESPGYGLYSYLLLSGRPQSEEEANRHLKAVEALLQSMSAVQALGQYVRQDQLNVTYIPVTELPKGTESDPDFAQAVLAVYDFARAQVLLQKFERTYDRGPYLISLSAPLTSRPDSVRAYVFQDFTGVVPELAARAVKNFVFFAAQQRTWVERSMRILPFKLRNLLAVAGREMPKIVDDLKIMIQFVELGE